METIADRILAVADEPNSIITVSLGRPRPPDESDAPWSCPFSIKGLDEDVEDAGHGEDAFQALLNALQGIRSYLDASRRTLTWSLCEPGETGFPKMIPMSFGRSLAQDIEQYMDQKVAAYGRPE